ncbi:MAG TPA: nitrilase-related carbon-nitrogen hydrolase, partial [Fimbriimonadaceae bacterium]|nr:nitrilase-related carbon-nitrogen hydrolase [Fimbriimonadaceae bacterium]
SADKTRLVIFGEYVPFRNLWPAGFNLPAGNLTPGDKTVTLDVGKFKVGEALCFEALFPDVPYRHALQGANVLAVMSIDDWYFGTNAPEQLRDASNWRAIETGLPVVRAASMGYSIIVDQRGRTVADAPLGGLRTVEAAVQVPDRADLFPLLPVFPYLSVLSLVGIPAFEIWRRRRSKA